MDGCTRRKRMEAGNDGRRGNGKKTRRGRDREGDEHDG